MKPHPKITYYLYLKGNMIKSVIENIGNDNAFKIHLEIKDSTGYLIAEESFTYLAPNQKFEIDVGRMSLGGPIDIGDHTAIITYRDGFQSILKQFEYSVDMINSLPTNNLSDINKTLKEIKRELSS